MEERKDKGGEEKEGTSSYMLLFEKSKRAYLVIGKRLELFLPVPH